MADTDEIPGYAIRYFYTMRHPHRWSSGEGVYQTDPDCGGYIESIDRARELAEKNAHGKWGQEDYCETTFGVLFEKEDR